MAVISVSPLLAVLAGFTLTVAAIEGVILFFGFFLKLYTEAR